MVSPLTMNETSIYRDELNRPFFAKKLEDQFVQLGNGWSYLFPEALHPNDLKVRLDVNLGNAAVFVRYDEDEQILSIEEDISELTGLYQIYVDLVDSENRTSAQTYLLSLIIFDEPNDEKALDDSEIPDIIKIA